MSKINLPLYHVKEIGFPFVEGCFTNKNGEEMEGFFLLDTGSTQNVLNKEVVRFLDESWIDDKTTKASGMDNQSEECKHANITIGLGEYKGIEGFSISENLDFKQAFGPNRIIGILGVDFMIKNKMVLDYETETFYTTAENMPELREKAFSFSFEFGLSTWGLPLMVFAKGDDDEAFFSVIDSGANDNHLGKRAYEFGTISSEYCKKERGIMYGIAGPMESSIANVKLSFLCDSDENDLKRLEMTDKFFVYNDLEYIASTEDENAPLVSGLLGTPFMHKRKWIVDFSHAVVYSNIATAHF